MKILKCFKRNVASFALVISMGTLALTLIRDCSADRTIKAECHSREIVYQDEIAESVYEVMEEARKFKLQDKPYNELANKLHSLKRLLRNHEKNDTYAEASRVPLTALIGEVELVKNQIIFGKKDFKLDPIIALGKEIAQSKELRGSWCD